MFTLRQEAYLESKSVAQIQDLTEKKLQAFVYTKRISLEPMFSDFDRQNSNKITIEQFKRGLASCGLVLNISEVDALVQQYSVPVPEQSVCLVDWRKFCDSVNHVFAPQVKNKSPSMEVCDSNSLVSTQKDLKIDIVRLSKSAELKGNDNESLQHALQVLREDSKKRRLFPKAFFKEFDKLNRGVISNTQFQRCLSVLGWNFKEEEMKALLWKYSTANSDLVDYRAFLADIDPTASFEPELISSLYQTGGPSSKELKRVDTLRSVEQILRSLQAEIFSRRLYLKDAFFDFDSLRSGFVTANRFRSVLNVTAQVSLSDAELQLLIDKYESSKHAGGVDYVRFVSDLEAIYINSSVDRNPLSTAPDTHTVRTLLSEVEDRIPETPEEKVATDALMARLVKMVNCHSIHHKPFFQSQDKTNCGLVSGTQFAAVLSTLKMPVTSDEVEFLQRRYCKSTQDSRIRYIAFCKDLDLLE